MITLEAERTLVHVVVNVAYAIKRVNRLCAGKQATAKAAAAQARIVGKGARATSRRLSRTLSVRVAGGERGGGWGVPLWGASTSVVGAQLGRLEAADRSRSVRFGKGEGVRGTAFSFPGKALVFMDASRGAVSRWCRCAWLRAVTCSKPQRLMVTMERDLPVDRCASS